MATPYQDFDAPTEGGSEYSGEFKLGGRLWKIRNRDDVPFEIVKRLMGQEDADPNAPADVQAKRAREVVMQTGPFFQATIAREEVDDFMVMFEDAKSALTLGKLRPVMEYVSRVVFTEDEERPTKPSKRKPPGRSATGATSAARSSSTATRRTA